MQLTYQQQLRNESDPAVIANLQRKGWVETVPPSYDAATQHAPEWVNGEWIVRDKTTEEMAAETALPNAENYQIRAWMIRNDLDPDAVPQMISQLVTDAKDQKEALMRWDYAVRVPRNFPLVNAIGAQMGLTPEQIDAAWPSIINL